MTFKNLLNNIEEERSRRLRGLEKPDPYAVALWQRAMDSLSDEKERQKVMGAYTFAKNIQYGHPGLESDIYFSHPIRVSAMSLIIDGSLRAESGILGLLHNALEVSHVSHEKLSCNFGSDIANQIRMLTVDRAVQWDKIYKTEYYRQIMISPRHVRIVKVVDKLDNLFLLGQNPDAKIRKMYLEEVEAFVLPIAAQTIPEIASYMSNLVANHKETYEIRS